MDATPNETWKPVVGCEGSYEVSDQGRVRSLDRMVWGGKAHYLRRGKILSPVKSAGRYQAVQMPDKNRAVAGRKQRTVLVQYLVAEAFLGPRPDGNYVRHLNDNPVDNRLENLAYGTPADNVSDMLENSGHYLGSRTHCNNGHEFTPENTALRSEKESRRNRSRRCKACQRARQNARNAELRLLKQQKGAELG